MTTFGRYLEVLRIPHLPSAIVTALVGRLSVGMAGLAIVLLVRHETGSYGAAGLVAASFAISAGLAAPLMGRLIDRLGIPRVVAPLSLVQPIALAALIVATRQQAPTSVLIACAVAAGAGSPPLFAAIQSLLASLAGARGSVEAAFALEAVLQEFVFLFGPVLVAVLAAAGSPSLALGACGALTLIGGISFALTPAARQFRSAEPEHDRLVGALSSPGIRTFALVGVSTGFAFGTLEVAMPAFAGQHGSPSTGGVLLGAVALGSMIGGILHGARASGRPLTRRYLVYILALALALAPLALADSTAAMLPLALVAGSFVAPSFATELALVDTLAPSGKVTEAFTWLTLAVVLGIAGGNAICGALVEGPGVRTALASASIFAALGALVAFARRRTLAVS